MVLSVQGNVEVGGVEVHTTHNRGHSAEELTEMALAKLINISDDAHPALKAQALAYREQMKNVIGFYIRQAMLSERTTMRAEIMAEIKEAS